MSAFASLIDQYAAGPEQLRQAVAGLSQEELHARPVAGKWSTLEVVSHIADFEPVYIDRMTRVIALDRPSYLSADENLFAVHLAYASRDIEEELAMIAANRKHMARILRTLPDSAFAREGLHSEAGVQTLEKLLRNITNHIPHHIAFIAEKRKALGK